MATRSRYVPALGFRWLTRLYDPVLRFLLGEKRFKTRLVEQATQRKPGRVLDLGAGTGTLSIMLKKAHPETTVVGLDGDSEVLDIAAAKAGRAGVELELHEGRAEAPPFPGQSFDVVVSSLLFHHLTTEQKRRSLAAVRSLLRPGGELHIADWGRPQNLLMRIAFFAVRLLDGFATTRANVRGELPQLIADAGFVDVEETHQATMFGTLSLYRASAPEGSGEVS